MKQLKIRCCLMAILLTVSLFAGCKKNTEGGSSLQSNKPVSSVPPTQEIEEAQGTWTPNLPEEKDLGGFEMSFAVYSGNDIIPQEGKSADDDLIRESMLDLQKRYHVTFSTVEIVDWNTEVLPPLLTGEEIASVLMPCVHQGGAYLSAGLLMDWNKKEIAQYIKPTENAWWNSTMAYASNVNGKVYAGACNIQNYAEGTHVCYFNKRILKSLGMQDTDLYKMYRDKTWTWDQFREIAKKAQKDLNNDGKMDEKDQYGFSSPMSDIVKALMSSANIDAVKTDNGRNAKYNFNSTHAIKTLTAINEIFTLDNSYFTDSMKTKNDQGTWAFVTQFTEGKALFALYTLGSAKQITMREMEDDYGLLPLPIGPSENGGWRDDYRSQVDHNFKACLIPINNKEAEKTAFLLEAIAFTRWQLTNNYMETYGSLYFSDDVAAEIVTQVYNWSSFEISQFFHSVGSGQWVELIQKPLGTLASTPNFDVTGTFSSVAEAAQIFINDYFAGK